MAIDFKTLIGIAYDAKQAQTDLNKQIKSLQKNTKLALNIELSETESKKVLQSQSKMWSNYRKEAVAAITAPNAELQRMSQHYKKIERDITNELSLKKKIYLDELTAYRLNEKLKQDEIKKTAKVQQDTLNVKSNGRILDNNISTFLKENTKLAPDLKNRLIEIQSKIKDVDATGLKNLKQNFREAISEAKAFGQTGDSVFTKLGKNVGQFMQFLSAGTIVMSSVNAVRNMVREVKELDSAMISLKKVTDETDAVYNKFLDNSANKARSLGRTISSLVEQTAEWAKLGYSLNEASKLAEISSIYANVGEVDDKTAVSDLVTGLKAMNMETSEAIRLVDMYNKLGNEFAVTSAGIGEGVKNSASALALQGNSIEQIVAMLTGGGEITQNVGELGNMLKVASLRIASMKGSLEELGETYDDILSVSSNQTKIYNLTKGQVNILDEQNNKLKDTYTILAEVAEAWDDVNKLEQSSLLELLFGKQRANQGAAILQAFQSGQVQAALDAANDSVGSALAEQQKYMEGIQYSADKMLASFQELSNNTVNSGWVKTFYELSNILIQIVDKTGLFNVALITTVGILNAKNGLVAFGWIDTLITKMGVATGAATSLSLAMSAIIPVAAIIGGITLAVKVYDHFNVTLEEHEEIIQTLKTEYDSLQAELSSVQKELETTGSKMDELLSKGNLTFLEKGELDALKESNEQLKTRISFLKEEELLKNKELNDSIEAKYNKQYGTDSKVQKTINESGSAWYDSSQYIGTGKGYIDYQIVRMKDLNNLKKENYSLTKEEQKEYDKIKESLIQAGLDYTKYAQDYTGTNNELKQSWIDVSKEIEKVINPAQLKTEVFDSVYNSESFSKVKEKLSEISDVTPELLKSTEEYRKLVEATGLVAEEVAEQINAMATSIEESTGKVERVAESIYSLAKAAGEATGYVNDLGENVDISKLQESINGALSAVKDFNSILKSMDENKGLTSDDLNTITQKYPQLLSYIGNETELRKKLIQGISDQKEVAKGYYKDILELDTNLYNTIMSNNATKVNELNQYYGTDLANYKSLAKAKNEVETTLLTSLNKKWADYYGAQSAASEIASHAQSSPLNAGVWGAAGGKNINDAAVRLAEEQTKLLKDKAKNEQFRYNQMKNLFINTDYTGLTVDNILLSNDKSSKDTKNKFSQLFNWIPIAAKKASEKAKSFIDSIADSISYKSKNNKIELAIGAKLDEKSSLEAIKKSYDNLAKNVGLSKEYRDLVDNGALKVETITDEKLANKIDEYTKWRDSAKNVGDEISKISGTIKELNQQKLDNIKSYFDMRNSSTDSKISKRNSLISLRESNGGTATKGDYNYLIKLQKDIIASNKKERDAYESLFNQQIKDKIIKKGSQEYYEGLSYLNDLTIASREAQVAIKDLSDEKIKLTFVEFDKDMEQTNKELSELDLTSGLVDKDSLEQLALFQTAYAIAAQKAKDLNAEIAKLNKQYDKGSVSEGVYKERLADLESQLSSNATAMQSYEQSIISAMKSRYDKELDLSDKALKSELKNIEKAKKARLDALKAELDKFKEVIDARKKALQDELDEENYQDEVSEYNKSISKLEDRIETLTQAEISGDLTARKERREAEDELAKHKKDLDKLQKKHSVDEAIDALDDEYDAYEKMKNKQISDAEAFYDLQTTQAQSVYDNKVAQLELLYENERQLIIEAAQLTSNEFGKAFDSINNTLAQYGISISSGLSSSFNNLGEGYANDTSRVSSVAKILGTKNESNKYQQDTTGMSELNEYLASQGYKMITTKQMVELAKALGLADINSTSLVGKDEIGRINKKRIKEALMNARFAKTGIVKAKGANALMNSMGEDGVVAVRDKEIILSQTDSKTFKDFVPAMNNLMAQLKPTIPDISNLSYDKGNTPIVTINLPASTTISKDAIESYRKFIPEITNEVSNAILTKSKSR